MRLRLNRSVLILAAALVAGVAAMLGARALIEARLHEVPKPQTLGVLVPQRDLPKGTALSRENVAVRHLPAESIHQSALRPEQADSLNGRVLSVDVRQGEPLLAAFFDPPRPATLVTRLSEDQRAITVSVDELNSLSGMLQPGNRIDLIVTIRNEARPRLLTLLQDVEVLATGTHVVPAESAKDARRTFTTITLHVSPEDAQRIMAARELGKLTALLRPAGSHATDPVTVRDAHTLLGMQSAPRARPPAASPQPQPPGIQIHYGIPRQGAIAANGPPANVPSAVIPPMIAAARALAAPMEAAPVAPAPAQP